VALANGASQHLEMLRQPFLQGNFYGSQRR
jgi:hypothetical protein